MYRNARKYSLTGTDAMVFEALFYLCEKTGEWKGTYSKLAQFSCCGGRMTAKRSVERLIAMGLIAQNEHGFAQIERQNAQNEQISKERRTKKENIKESPKVSNKRAGQPDFSKKFLEFWRRYAPLVKYDNRKKATAAIFDSDEFPESWRDLAVARAENHSPEANPYFWIKENHFLRETIDVKKKEPAHPYYLTQKEIGEAWSRGVNLILVQDNETQLYHRITEDTYKNFKDGNWFTVPPAQPS